MADNGLVPDVLRRRAPSFRSSSALEQLLSLSNWKILLQTRNGHIPSVFPFVKRNRGKDEKWQLVRHHNDAIVLKIIVFLWHNEFYLLGFRYVDISGCTICENEICFKVAQ